MEKLNLIQQKEEGICQYQNQVIMLQSFSYKNLLAIEMKKTKILMNKQSIQDFRYQKQVKYQNEFWYYYVKPKYDIKAKLNCLGTVIFTIYIKANNI